jgi:hypothetical protein
MMEREMSTDAIRYNAPLLRSAYGRRGSAECSSAANRRIAQQPFRNHSIQAINDPAWAGRGISVLVWGSPVGDSEGAMECKSTGSREV